MFERKRKQTFVLAERLHIRAAECGQRVLFRSPTFGGLVPSPLFRPSPRHFFFFIFFIALCRIATSHQASRISYPLALSYRCIMSVRSHLGFAFMIAAVLFVVFLAAIQTPSSSSVPPLPGRPRFGLIPACNNNPSPTENGVE